MRGDGRIFRKPNSKFWWIAYYGPAADGTMREIRESSRSEQEATAQKLLRKRTREVGNHRSAIRTFEGPKQERLTVSDLLNSLEADYRRRSIKSLGRTLNHMKPVRKFFEHVRAVSVTPDLIRRYVETRRTPKKTSSGAAKTLSQAKVNRELEVLASAFSLAVKEERIAHKPHIPYLSEAGNVRRGFFERDELDRIVEHLNSPMKEMVEFAFVSAWRKEEIRTLRWENVDRAAKEVRLFDSKNGEGRVLPLDESTWTLFEALWSRRQFTTPAGPALSEFVFHCGNGRPVGEANFEILWRRARTKAGLPAKLFHDLRRSAIRNLVRAGVPERVAMSISGHRTRSVFDRYNITSSDDKREALRKRAEYVNSKPATNVAEFRKANTDR